MKIKHLFSPRYVYYRGKQIRFEKSDPTAPWLTATAVLLLEEWLKPTDFGLEWGSGRSTSWFASRVGKMVSVESNQAWFKIVTDKLAAQGLKEKVEYHWEKTEGNVHQTDWPEDPYVRVIDAFPDQTFDFILVDGVHRLGCFKRAIAKVKPGGMIILDNANRYVPNLTPRGFTTVHEPRADYSSVEWGTLLGQIAHWRKIHTTDGIWDTRFWIKPI